MAALRHINVRGMRIEIWDTSFRIEGMSRAIQVSGPGLSDQCVKQLVESIYDHIRNHAEQSAESRVLNHLTKTFEELVKRPR